MLWFLFLSCFYKLLIKTTDCFEETTDCFEETTDCFSDIILKQFWFFVYLISFSVIQHWISLYLQSLRKSPLNNSTPLSFKAIYSNRHPLDQPLHPSVLFLEVFYFLLILLSGLLMGFLHLSQLLLKGQHHYCLIRLGHACHVAGWYHLLLWFLPALLGPTVGANCSRTSLGTGRTIDFGYCSVGLHAFNTPSLIFLAGWLLRRVGYLQMALQRSSQWGSSVRLSKYCR